MVAKSFQNLPIVSDVYIQNGRQYVKVQKPNGTLQQVRWYSDAEYARMYGEPEPKLPGSQRLALGFEKGYITIFKGDTYPYKDWLKEQGARYAKFWGWYIISTMNVPEEMPSGVEAVRLDWDVVGKGEDLLPDDQVKSAVEALIYDPSNSEFQGIVGERIERYVTIDRIVEIDGAYGPSKMYIMSDDCGNVYVWTTSAARNWDSGDNIHIKGTVKDFRTFRNTKQTILTRVTECK